MTMTQGGFGFLLGTVRTTQGPLPLLQNLGRLGAGARAAVLEHHADSAS